MATESTIASRRLRCSIWRGAVAGSANPHPALSRMRGGYGGGRRDRVVAAAAPGVAAQEPSYREERTARRAMSRDSFRGVVRAAWVKATRRPEDRRHQQLIGADHSPNRQTDRQTDRQTWHAARAGAIFHLNPPRSGGIGAR